MRLLPCFAAALLLAAAPLTTQIADACGGYEMFQRAPQALAVSRHMSSDVVTPLRSFAILSTIDTPRNVQWTGVAHRTYDAAKITSLGTMSSPIKVTLIGTHPPRVVTLRRHVALANAMYQLDSTFDAVELPTRRNEEIAVVLVGDYSDATWHPIHGRYTREQPIAETGLHFTPLFKDNIAHFELRHGDRKLGTHPGSVTGAVDIDGVRYVVVSDLGVARLMRVTRVTRV